MVGAQDWRPRVLGFNAAECWRQFCSELWQFHLTHFASLLEETQKDIGTSCNLVCIPGEVKISYTGEGSLALEWAVWSIPRAYLIPITDTKAVSARHVFDRFAADRKRFAAGCPCPHGSGREPFAIGRVRSTLSCGHSPNQQLLSCVTVRRDILVFDTHTDRNPNVSLNFATNHWFVKVSINSCCFTVLEAKTSTENVRQHMRSGQIGIAFACILAFLADFCWIVFYFQQKCTLLP